MNEPESDPDFIAFWKTLLDRSAGLRAFTKDHQQIRGLSLADFREAMAEAFCAGKAAGDPLPSQLAEAIRHADAVFGKAPGKGGAN